MMRAKARAEMVSDHHMESQLPHLVPLYAPQPSVSRTKVHTATTVPLSSLKRTQSQR